jgi:hypothetical protein
MIIFIAVVVCVLPILIFLKGEGGKIEKGKTF